MPESGMTESLPSVSKLASLPEGEAAVRTSKALYRAALGPVNAGHYLAMFERFDANGRAGLVWNPAAGFFTPGWLVFRRLWAWAAGYVALMLTLLLLGRGVSSQLALWPTGVVVGLVGSLVLLLVVLPGLAGNAILHAHTRQRVARAKAGAPSLGDACIVLAEDAPSWNSLKAVLLGSGVAVIGFVAAVALSPGAGAPPVKGSPVEALASSKVETPAPPTLVNPSPAKAMERKPEAPAVSVPANPETMATAAQPEPPAAPPDAVVAPTVEGRPAAEPAQKPAEAPPVETPQPGASVPAPAPKSKPTSATTPLVRDLKPKPRPSAVEAASAASTYAINVGVFADAANAERVMAQLKAAKLAAYTQRIDGAKGPLTRVRVGPFSDGEQAAAAAQRIRALGLEALVFRP
jgi:cell division protein FtsN